jgi:hypothetical protein
MRLLEKIILFILIVLTIAVTPHNLFWVFAVWSSLLLFIGYLIIRRAEKALREITCALFGGDWYKGELTKETKAYEILLELYEDSEIYQGMNVSEVDNLLKDKFHGNYSELSLWRYFGEISTNKDRFKNEKIVIRNFKVFPRRALKFIIKNSKIVLIEEIIDDGRDSLWGGL